MKTAIWIIVSVVVVAAILSLLSYFGYFGNNSPIKPGKCNVIRTGSDAFETANQTPIKLEGVYYRGRCIV